MRSSTARPMTKKPPASSTEVIQNEANRLSRLIDNILNISRNESGLVKINKQPQSLTIIMKEALEVISPQAAQKDRPLKEQFTPRLLSRLLADKDMLYQAVLNLLSNAVKYTPEGGTISVETLVDEAKRKIVMHPHIRHRRRDSTKGTSPLCSTISSTGPKPTTAWAKGTEEWGSSLVKQIIERRPSTAASSWKAIIGEVQLFRLRARNSGNAMRKGDTESIA